MRHCMSKVSRATAGDAAAAAGLLRMRDCHAAKMRLPAKADSVGAGSHSFVAVEELETGRDCSIQDLPIVALDVLFATRRSLQSDHQN